MSSLSTALEVDRTFLALFELESKSLMIVVGATIVVAQALCLSIFNLSPTQKFCLYTNGNKANVSDGGTAVIGVTDTSIAMSYWRVVALLSFLTLAEPHFLFRNRRKSQFKCSVLGGFRARRWILK